MTSTSATGGSANSSGYAERIWKHFLLAVRALWVVRVPIVTTVLGLVILYTLPQAQDMFIDSSASRRQLFFLVPMLLVWALPTYYAAQQLLETDARFQEHARPYGASARITQAAVAVSLGLLTFAAVFLGMRQARAALENLKHYPPKIAAIDRAETALFHHELLLAACLAAFIAFIYWFPRLSDIGRTAIARFVVKWLPGWRWLSLLLAIFFALLALLIIFPVQVAAWFPRGFAIPFILGGWVPFLSYLGSLGRKLRFPVITALGLVLILLNAWLGDDHAVRLLSVAPSAATQPIALEQAVMMWRAENCPGPAPCPRPIVIATAGGASRAAFFTASAIGQIMMAPAGSEAPFDPNTVRNRLFAISSVSGGSMGAVMVTAALKAEADSHHQPCTPAPTTLWWDAAIGSWRDCFEALTSGDFLTPVIFGLAFHDAFGFLPIKDRAVLLENAWSQRFDNLVPQATPSVQSYAQGSAPDPNCIGLDCGLLTLQPQPGHWIPLLILNGTSERTGGRIITTPLATEYEYKAAAENAAESKCAKLFPGAHDFYDLLHPHTACETATSGTAQSAGTPAGVFEDVRVSTAALNSARFPIISPPGAVQAGAGEDAVDHIVDGGYFDNYGIESAADLVKALRKIAPDLAPLVVVITNDPSDEHFPTDPAGAGDNATQDEQKALQAPSSKLLTDITAPVVTVMNNRNLRGVITYVQSSRELDQKKKSDRPIHLAVWGTTISLSWWLSALEQEYLHDQINDDAAHNDALLCEIRQVLQPALSCQPPPNAANQSSATAK